MNEKIESVLNSPWVVPAAVGAFGFASGLGLGFFLGKRQQMNAEVHEFPLPVDLHFEDGEVIVKESETEITRPPKVVLTPEAAEEHGIVTVSDLSDLRASMVSPEDQDEDGDSSEEAVMDAEAVAEMEMVEAITEAIDWDWEEELEQRTETAPYILHEDEYVENESQFHQQVLTFYTKDGVLADEDGDPVPNVPAAIGPLKFGHGCRDEDTFFVRNHERRAEYEVNRVNGSFAMEVLGYYAESDAEASDLRHSHRPGKFRGE